MKREDIEKEADKRYKHPQIDNMDACGHQAFCEGAEWAQSQLVHEPNNLEGITSAEFVHQLYGYRYGYKKAVEWACEWLKQKFRDKDGSIALSWLVFLDEFKKAIEE